MLGVTSFTVLEDADGRRHPLVARVSLRGGGSAARREGHSELEVPVEDIGGRRVRRVGSFVTKPVLLLCGPPTQEPGEAPRCSAGRANLWPVPMLRGLREGAGRILL